MKSKRVPVHTLPRRLSASRILYLRIWWVGMDVPFWLVREVRNDAAVPLRVVEQSGTIYVCSADNLSDLSDRQMMAAIHYNMVHTYLRFDSSEVQHVYVQYDDGGGEKFISSEWSER